MKRALAIALLLIASPGLTKPFPVHGETCTLLENAEVYNRPDGEIVDHWKKGKRIDISFRRIDPDHRDWTPVDINTSPYGEVWIKGNVRYNKCEQ
jgi:hypothetical protein